MMQTNVLSTNPRHAIDRDWQHAPFVVKYLAYWYSLFAMLVSLGVMVGSAAIGPGYLWGMLFFGFIVLVNAYVRFSLSKGTKAAWIMQIVASLIGLFFFPIGTVLNPFILVMWFRPSTRAWFGF